VQVLSIEKRDFSLLGFYGFMATFVKFESKFKKVFKIEELKLL